ncbi:MAG: regulatory protein RecX [Desulfurella sp.]|uniref:Regulatory protein RecX n=1 Tax=Desulfurella multipotens TaxID=79269 RepID=A0A1G6JYU3_9BACT|nr:regulatory protein RecX [Desulfurella multipotens]SDC23863.1 regulatory protein [Desulfurella multipotens]
MEGLDYAFKLISKKRYTSKELQEKLEKKGIDPEPIINRLKELNYLNDLEYAIDYKNKKQNEGYGKYKILFHLKNKGISEDILNNLEFSNSKLEEIFLSKIQKIKDNKKQKIYAFLINRGFDSSDIKNLIYKYEDKL